MNDYYNEKAKEFISSVHHLDMSSLYEKFEHYLKPESSILDVGSGSGRDSLYFLKKGHKVTSFDSSESLVEFSKVFLSDVRLETFESFTSLEKYDGIWACASLLHVERYDLSRIIHKYAQYLKEEGIFYMSFKSCDYDYIKDGRQFTCFTLNTMKEFLNHIPDTKIVDLFETHDVRPEKVEIWINAIIAKY